jgi:hypothetical protein
MPTIRISETAFVDNPDCRSNDNACQSTLHNSLLFSDPEMTADSNTGQMICAQRHSVRVSHFTR